MSIEAALWRDQRRQKLDKVLAWRIAGLMRTKRLPSLKQMLAEPAKPLKGAELERRRREYKEMTAAVDLSALAGKVGMKNGKE